MPGVSEETWLKWENENLRRFAHEQAARMGELQRESERLRKAIRTSLNELGVPDSDYPAPVANAVDLLISALADTGGEA